MEQSQIQLAESYFAHANTMIQQGQFAAAVESYNRVISLNPNFVDAYLNGGSALAALKRFEEALANYDRAIVLKPDYVLAHVNRGLVQRSLGRLEEAIASFTRAIVIQPNTPDAYYNRANAFQEAGQFDAALADYNRAVALNPNYAEAFDNRGLLLNRLNRLEEAVTNHSKAIALRPDIAHGYLHRGNALNDLNQLEEAAKDYENAFHLAPNTDYLLGMLLQIKMRISDWSHLEEFTAELVKRIEGGEKASTAFPLHYLTNLPWIQRKVAELYTNNERPFNAALGNILKRPRASKIRVGYFSADFREHAVSILLAEIFERHDKNRFEIIAFSFGPDVKDDMRARLENAFDEFVDVRNLADIEIAQLARQMNIDIAVDLGGDTANSRSGLFAYRAAPIQVNYLGWPGTMGADYFDYLIADYTLIPKQSRQYYVEKIAYLPNCYQANDSQRKASDKLFSRAELDLPESGFVFCCFNNNFKITPQLFDSWMRILKAVHGSVLFLYADNETAKRNMQKEAQARGVDASRLVFGKRIAPADYLARLKAADLFLNTFPYDAGTTASDALWMGLPVLTRMGESFVSRVAASLLKAIGLPELITTSQEEYEALAIELATQPDKLTTIKEKLIANKSTTPLFDTQLFTDNLEDAYTQMVDRYYANLAPDHIYLGKVDTVSESAAHAKLDEAISLIEKRELAQAKAIYEHVLALEPNNAEALHWLGVIANQTGNPQIAYDLISKAIAINPYHATYYFSRGLALQNLNQQQAAIENYDRALLIKPDFAESYSNRGNALQALGQLEAAIESFTQAVKLKPNYVDAYANRGNAQLMFHKPDAALESYKKALNIKPNFNYLLGTLLYTKLKLCDWTDLDKNTAELIKRIEKGEKATIGFYAIALATSSALQRKAAEIWINDNHPANHSLGDIPKRAPSNKIRIGYFSADFRLHAVSILMAEIFELHDKNRFEVIAFSLGPSTKDVMRERIEKAVDQFLDVRHLTDGEIAQLSRQMNIDIAVDLGGTTVGTRPGVFSYRAAPVQVNYLGYPGTMGADYFDYLIADETIIPEAAQQHYVEKIAYLPDCYQANDSKRKISSRVFSRAELGLPNEGFIFCCFNNNYKITPEVFSGWMRILKAVKGSVLLLYAENETAQQNLRKVAKTAGIGTNRLVFGEGLAFGDYLARYKTADLFLNTHPYDAGTTASDALWAGLPVLTRLGETFSSRVAASLLKAIDLPELITYSQKEYEALAIELATHPDKLKSIKEKLEQNRLTTPLFNTPVFTKHLENVYAQMMARYYAGLKPEPIYVKGADPINVQAKLDEAIAWLNQNQLEQASTACEEVLVAQPNHADAFHVLGVIAYQMGNLPRAVELMTQAITIDPSPALFYSNRGGALHMQKQLEEAIKDYDRAISINPDLFDAYFNRANARRELNRLEEAVADYDRVIQLKPDHASAYFNRGIVLQDLKRWEEALESHNQAININPDYADAYACRGTALQQLKQSDAAIESFEKAIQLKPDYDYLLGSLVFIKMRSCDWSHLSENTAEIIKRIERGEKATDCFPLLPLTHSLALQRKAAEICTNDKYPFNNALGDIPKHPRSEKIRVGYFSADFRHHAVSILLAELFELHDKNRFEIIAFSFGPDKQDDMRKRLEKTFDQFIDVRTLSDKAVAALARQMNIDIAIDLGGATAGTRTGIFSYRAAPIQANYLGWPGTMGVNYFDYLMADRTIVPEDAQQHYLEKIVYLPNCYQANDTKRKVSDRVFSRAELGLPEDGFVFCCFNNNYKITPEIFDSWVRILKAVKGSVLFLYADNEAAKRNLKNEAVARGMDVNRLIFGERLETSEYLARYKAADLFLNTYPYDAGTTASDALWVGLPVLTRLGDTFVSRVAASLVKAIGLPELVATSEEHYEALAIELATHPDKLKAIKEKLLANRLTTPLFDTKLFTKHLEDAYTQMVERYQADLAPEYIYV